MKRLFTSITLLVALGLIFSVACSSEAEVIVEEKIVEVEKEVIKEVEVEVIEVFLINLLYQFFLKFQRVVQKKLKKLEEGKENK